MIDFHKAMLGHVVENDEQKATRRRAGEVAKTPIFAARTSYRPNRGTQSVIAGFYPTPSSTAAPLIKPERESLNKLLPQVAAFRSKVPLGALELLDKVQRGYDDNNGRPVPLTSTDAAKALGITPSDAQQRIQTLTDANLLTWTANSLGAPAVRPNLG